MKRKETYVFEEFTVYFYHVPYLLQLSHLNPKKGQGRETLHKLKCLTQPLTSLLTEASKL